jgi:hypothetical protein
MKLLEYETTGVVIDETAFWLFYITRLIFLLRSSMVLFDISLFFSAVIARQRILRFQTAIRKYLLCEAYFWDHGMSLSAMRTVLVGRFLLMKVMKQFFETIHEVDDENTLHYTISTSG